MATSRRPPTDSMSPPSNRPTSAIPPTGPSPTAAPPASVAPGAGPTTAQGAVAPRKRATSARPRSTKVAAGSGAVGAPDGKARKGGAARANAVTADQRHAMIAEAAYLRAERRGFTGGDATADWLAAEREVDELLGANVTNPAQ